MGTSRPRRRQVRLERGGLELAEDLVGRETPDAVSAQDLHYIGHAEPSRHSGRGGNFEERPEPGLVGSRRQPEHLREEPVKLLAQPVL